MENAINRTYHARPDAGEVWEKSSCSRRFDTKSACSLENLGRFASVPSRFPPRRHGRPHVYGRLLGRAPEGSGPGVEDEPRL